MGRYWYIRYSFEQDTHDDYDDHYNEFQIDKEYRDNHDSILYEMIPCYYDENGEKKIYTLEDMHKFLDRSITKVNDIKSIIMDLIDHNTWSMNYQSLEIMILSTIIKEMDCNDKTKL